MPKKHPAIIDQELWESVQPPEKKAPYLPGHLLYGLVRKGYRLHKDPKKAKKVFQMFKLWLDRKTLPEIEKATAMNRSTIWRRIKNPNYANRIEIPGKPPQEWPEAGVEPIISFEMWLAAQNIPFNRPAWEISRDSRKERMGRAVERLYGLIERAPATSAELLKITEYKKGKVHRYLRELKKNGRIERESGKYGKWYIKTTKAFQGTGAH